MTPSPLSEKLVLVVDDDILLTQLIAITLEMDGINTITAHNGFEALDLLQNTTPDMIMLDLMLPEMDGLRFIELLRKQPKFDHIPVLVLSALDKPEIREEMLAAGAAGFVLKPVQISYLLKEVRTLLKTHA